MKEIALPKSDTLLGILLGLEIEGLFLKERIKKL
jgi:hypothetical protein